MKKLSFRFAVNLGIGTLLGALASPLLVLPAWAGTIPVIQNFSSLTTNSGFSGNNNSNNLAALNQAAQEILTSLKGGNATSQLLASILVNPSSNDKTQFSQLLQGLGISSESSEALLQVLPGLLSETPSTTVNVTKLANAIAIYNQIINESSPEVLAALAQNTDFKAVREALKNLRAAIK
ncbi:hypothetical protein V2H45_00845 [Tumidithrix elongata RA019]|uniref:DUF2780 domain-containing protein n=1 Tax=Tumidithrix elongata BACA0141 TaxID=2716417 RepID=A0AAW9PSV8_9CYAN|nr:hypothetical protein [Tumidithrix elongata RA019]